MFKKVVFILFIICSQVFAVNDWTKNRYNWEHVYFDGTVDLIHTTYALFDSSVFKIEKTTLKEWQLKIYDKVGVKMFEVDSSGAGYFAGTFAVAGITTLSNRLNVNVSGAVIGLSVDGNKTTGNLAQFINDNDGAVGDSSVVIDKLGNTGFNTFPHHILDIETGGAEVIGLAITNATTDSSVFMPDSTNLQNGAVRISNAGRVGIGIVPSTRTLKVAGAIQAIGTNTGGYGELIATNFSDNKSIYFRQHSSTSGGTTFGISNTNAGFLLSSGSSILGIGTLGSVSLIFATNNVERFRILPTGRSVFGSITNTTAIIKIDGNKTTDNLFEAVNDADGVATGDSSAVIDKLGRVLSQWIVGCMGFADSTSIIDASINVPSQITNSANTLMASHRADYVTVAGDTMTITKTGWYNIRYDWSFSGNNTDLYHLTVRINNVEVPNMLHCRRGITTTKSGVVSAGGDRYLTSGDDISFWIENTANNNDPTFYEGNVNVYYTGE